MNDLSLNLWPPFKQSNGVITHRTSTAVIGVGTTYSFTDFPHAKMILSTNDSGLSTSAYIGLVVEGVSTDTSAGIGIYTIGSTTTSAIGYGIYARAIVRDAADTPTAAGILAQATSSRAAGRNVAVYANASGSASGMNFSLYGSHGVLYNLDPVYLGTETFDTTVTLGLYATKTADTTNLLDAVTIKSLATAKGAYNGTAGLFTASVNATGDTGAATGGSFVSTTTHAGGDNIAVRANASGSSTNNYSFYGDAGNFYNYGVATVKGTTNNGTTNTFLSQDSDGANVFWVDTDGGVHANTLELGGSTTIGDITIQKNDDTTAGTFLKFFKNSATPANGDDIATFNYEANNSAGTRITYASILGQSNNVLLGDECGEIIFSVMGDGTMREYMRVTGKTLSSPFADVTVEARFLVKNAFDFQDNAPMRFGTGTDDQFIFHTGETNEMLKLAYHNSNPQMLITNITNVAKNSGAGTVSDPTFTFFASEDVSVSNNRFGRISHDGDNFYFTTGANTGAGSVPATINNGINFNVGSLTSCDTASFGYKFTRVLNDTGVAGGSDTYTNLWGVITETDVTGCNTIYHAKFDTGTTNVFNIDDKGRMSQAITGLASASAGISTIVTGANSSGAAVIRGQATVTAGTTQVCAFEGKLTSGAMNAGDFLSPYLGYYVGHASDAAGSFVGIFTASGYTKNGSGALVAAFTDASAAAGGSAYDLWGTAINADLTIKPLWIISEHAGANTNLYGGSANSTGGAVNGGNLNLYGGSAAGGGTDGSVVIQTGWTASGKTCADLGTVTTADINGGTIDGATIGAASASTIVGTTITANTGLVPDANDGAYIGQPGTAFSDVFLASGGVINWDSSDVTITHSANTLAFAGATSGYTFDASLVVKSLINAQSSESVNDDATITLATGVAGVLEVWTEAEYMRCYVDTAGTVISIYASTNTAIADTDGNLCVYDGGTGAVIKNRLGSTKTVRYNYIYS